MNGHQGTGTSGDTGITPLPRETGDEISLIELINTVLNNRRLVILTPLVLFVLIIGFTLIQPPIYSAFSSFLPQSPSGQGSLSSSIAAQFGFTLPAGETGQTPQFYADLIGSREILKDLVDNTYSYRDGEELVHAPLPELLKKEDENEQLAREWTIEALGKCVSVSTNRETGLVTFTIRTRWPEVSEGIARDILELLNQFNLNTRHTQATAEREFVEERLGEVKVELRAAEDSLEDFLQKNRQWQGAHELEFIHDRLFRDMTMRQQVVTTLIQAHEQARIDEVRDTPVITIVGHPETPVLPDRRNLGLKGVLALMVGSILGIFGAFGRWFMIRGGLQEIDHYTEYERLKRETVRDLKNPLRLLKS